MGCYQIIVKGEAKSNYKDLSILDGISCDIDFVEYLDAYCDIDGTIGPKLNYGHMFFKYEYGKLWTITEYDANESLTNDELEILRDYTSGQWSDGIGEGFEQEPCLIIGGSEVFVSPWHPKQRSTIKQIEIHE